MITELKKGSSVKFVSNPELIEILKGQGWVCEIEECTTEGDTLHEIQVKRGRGRPRLSAETQGE